MSQLSFHVDFVPPYRLGYPDAPGPVRRAFWLAGRPAVLELTQEGDDGPVTAHAYSDRPLEGLLPELTAAARHVISAHDDLAAFRAAIAADPPLAALAVQVGAVKPLRIPDLWTTLFRMIVYQQISGAAAAAIERRVSARFGCLLDIGGESVPVPPDPASLLGATAEELAGTGLSRSKAAYIQGIAEAFAAGRLDSTSLRHLPPEEAIELLTRERGIGRWTAECALLFGAGERDVLPADDLGVRKGLARLYGLPDLPPPAEVRRWGEERWVGWRSYVALYLWRLQGMS